MSRHVRISRMCCRSLLSSPPASPLPYSIAVRSSQPVAKSCCQVRSYAAVRTTKPDKRMAEVYSLQEIPLQTFQDIIGRNEGIFTRLSPERYYECAVKFARAVENGSHPFSIKMTGGDCFTAAEMHETGCIMRHIQGKRSAEAFAVALWASASELGYAPATVTLARQLIRSGSWGHKAPLRRAETRFKQIVSEGRDPNALTVEGEHLLMQGKHEAAVRILHGALRPGSQAFEWKPFCQLCLGRAYMQLGRQAEAKEAFESLRTSDSSLVEAEMELGQLLRATDKDLAEQYLYVAGINGRPEMFRHLSEIAFEKAASSTEESSRNDYERWAMEWSRLADPKVKE